MSDDRGRVPPPVDLSPLDPFEQPERMDAVVAAIVGAGMSARRAPGRVGVVRQVGGWTAPALAAAALVLAVSVPAMLSSGAAGRAAPAMPTSVDSSATGGRFGLPAPVIALARANRSPTPTEIVAAFDAQWPKGPQ